MSEQLDLETEDVARFGDRPTENVVACLRDLLKYAPTAHHWGIHVAIHRLAEVTRLREENEKWQAMAQTAGFPVDGLLAVGSELTRLRAMLGKATVRLGIVRDRMEACEADRPATHDHSHALSLFEIPAWIEEQSSLLSSPHEEIGR